MRPVQVKPADRIRPDIEKVLRTVFPDGVVDLNVDPEESYFARIGQKLRSELGMIKNAFIMYERDWSGEGSDSDHRGADSEDDEDWEATSGPDKFSSSYHLFFIGISTPDCQMPCTDEHEDEDGKTEKVEGTLTVGCSLGVSLLARFAVVKLDDMKQFEDGSHACPDIGRPVFLGEDGKVDYDDHCRVLWGEKAYRNAAELRDTLARLLATFRIKVIPDDEGRKPAPWLKPGEDVFVPAMPGEPVTVTDALFFRGP